MTNCTINTNIRHAGQDTKETIYRRVKPAKLLPQTAHDAQRLNQPHRLNLVKIHSPDGTTGTHPIKYLTTQFIDPKRMKG